MSNKAKLILEFSWLYLILPVSYLWDYPVPIKMALALISFAFIFRYLWVKKAFRLGYDTETIIPFFKTVLLRFVVIGISLTAFTYLFYRSMFFGVLINNPKLWLFILFVYSLFSVTLQELVYRTFFFERYATIFKKTSLMILVNGLVFSLGHIFFKNEVVLVLTFVGGILFALTYLKTKSTLLVCIEHTLYGFWLFTVGIGGLVGFPGVS